MTFIHLRASGYLVTSNLPRNDCNARLRNLPHFGSRMVNHVNRKRARNLNVFWIQRLLSISLIISFFFQDVNCPFARRRIFFTDRFLMGDDSRLTFNQLHLLLLVILFYGISFWTHKRSYLIEKKGGSEEFHHLFLFYI